MPRQFDVIGEKPLGSTVPIRVNVVERTTTGIDGDPYSPYAITLTITNPRGTSVVNEDSMTLVTLGDYVYEWDTSSITLPGNYLVRVSVRVSAGAVTDYETLGVVVLK